MVLEATEQLNPSGSSPSSLVTFDPDEAEDESDIKHRVLLTELFAPLFAISFPEAAILLVSDGDRDLSTSGPHSGQMSAHA